MGREITGYAYDFVSYLISKSFWDKIALRRIILYGSAAREETIKSSDVDIFVDISSGDSEIVRRKIQNASTLFYKSERMKKWRLKGINNEFSIIVGNLADTAWDDLRDTISLYGITLWERFQAKPSEELRRYMVFSWVSKGASKQAQVNLCRRLYGYTSSGKKYEGLLKNIGGRRLSTGVVLVPAEHASQLRKLLRELKMKYKLIEVFK